MAWHLAPALAQLRAEVDKKWPNRSKASDGTIGDAAHSSRTSDHNPNARGSVNAVDITAKGIDTGTLIAVAKKHPSVRYIIHNRKIMNRDIGNWSPRAYNGANPHTQHVHISLYQSATAENRKQSWGLADAKPVNGVGGGSSGSPTYTQIYLGALLKTYVKGTPVKDVQKHLGLKVDGFYGDDTKNAVVKFQKSKGLSADGIVGDDTWAALKADGMKPSPSDKPKAPAVPAFPLPAGHWYGPESKNPKNHSGFYAKDRAGIKQFQSKLKERGWSINPDGLFGPQTSKVVKQFQAEKKLKADGGVGIDTWKAIWSEPVT